ncbi:MAG: hypothetical protein COW00_20055 [Bdellovibrio sp. CG12_big_fil_rev_8_21_14_0_65_39_13]|nr:MAG: hypothetical protein COW78_02810 [Bdellovibrio sp. CG22_combo_CG10-13_8_21_14_all_39_27]PIQ57523.1 MAG: hypothetical protein COW00_20055 [Bdellovibrio sp. CG12_big_fil_rev_8_21_14_0_65_39_13]PIR33725.1 MAG: hypothetical protein COV37_15140 [Bdellovibrio sp. CG11_big_fil_rev_8_21_14_0_20_39_38]PJB53085.1 MAG: hypothetical protein CO099_09045 [Bdellovibrio sp. CG_4_9_14_3_um_filter_39_7]
MHNLNLSDSENPSAWEQIQHELVSESFNFYGMIVYRDQDSNLFKALREEDTWSALHEITGEDLLIFAFQDRAYRQKEESTPKHIGFMCALPTSLSSNTSTSIEYSKLIKGFTGKEIKVDCPFWLLFCNKTKKYIALELSQFKSPEEYAHYLKEVAKFIMTNIENSSDLQLLETNWCNGGGTSIARGTIIQKFKDSPSLILDFLNFFK